MKANAGMTATTFANAIPNFDDMQDAFYGSIGDAELAGIANMSKLRSHSKMEESTTPVIATKSSVVLPLPHGCQDNSTFKSTFANNNQMSLSRNSSFRPFTKRDFNNSANSNSMEGVPMHQRFSLSRA